MYSSETFCVFSEIGALKQVMLHRPGKELDRLTNENRDELLFDELIWLDLAQREHDSFADILRGVGTEVLYFEDCLAEVIEDKQIRTQFVRETLAMEALDRRITDCMTEFFMSVPSKRLAQHFIEGYSREEAKEICDSSLSLIGKVSSGSEFLIHPIPNLYFQRDPAITISNGIILGQMTFEARRREPLYWKYITKYHPRFKGMKIIFGDKPDEVWPQRIEGGDVLALSDKVIAVGVSQRTAPTSVQRLGRELAKQTTIKRILAFEIPHMRYCMHLDTVFTMADVDKFTMFPPLRNHLKVWQLDYNDDGTLRKLTGWQDWEKALAESLGLDRIQVIEMQAENDAATYREQWNDGCNALAVAPGKVIAYNRNTNSNKLLRDNGIEVLELDGSELGRGRGGPRCMSMPLNRADIK